MVFLNLNEKQKEKIAIFNNYDDSSNLTINVLNHFVLSSKL